jgi:hypothetical protein
MTRKLLTAIFLTISLIFASCASHTAVYPEPVNIQSFIKPGDTVRVVTKDNQETEFVVTEVTDEAIIGENHKVLFTDITKLEEQTRSAGENFTTITIITLGFAAGAVGGFAAVALAGSAAGAAGAEAGIVGGAVVGGAAGAAGAAAADEDATKRDSSCMIHPKYHPGDWFAAITIWFGTGDFEERFFSMRKERYWEVYAGIDNRLCFEECHSSFNCKYEETFQRDFESNMEDSRQKYFKGIKSCSEKLRDCIFECIEKAHPLGDIAEHIEGGYYSDGSYYARCRNAFENIHPTKDKYEKTKWQKDRDECMELTYARGFQKNPTPVKYYRQCLKERGYSINLY